MSAKFESCHAITAKWEGGWSDHPSDPGGKTMYGITQATLSAYLGRPVSATEIRSLTLAQAKAIYEARFWKRVAGDELPAGVDLCVYDFGVNSGPDRAVKSLQAALGVEADGWVGELTLKALSDHPNSARLIRDLCDRREAFLRGLPTFKQFGKGWMNRLSDIRLQALRMSRGSALVATSADPTPPEGTAKAEPAPPVEKTISTEQKVGGAAAVVVVTTTLGPVAGFWRDNKDVLSDPAFLGVAGVLVVVILFMLFRKPKSIEAQA